MKYSILKYYRYFIYIENYKWQLISDVLLF